MTYSTDVSFFLNPVSFAYSFYLGLMSELPASVASHFHVSSSKSPLSINSEKKKSNHTQ